MYVYIVLLDQKKKKTAEEQQKKKKEKSNQCTALKKKKQFKAREKQPTEQLEHNNFEVGGLVTTIRNELKFQKFNRSTGGPHVLEKKRKEKKKIRIYAKGEKKS